MNDESRRVLDLLAQGKITVSEAEQLLKALNEGHSEPTASSGEPKTAHGTEKPRPKYLCVNVEPLPGSVSRHKTPVNIRLPLDFLRSGVKLAGILPEVVQGRVAERLREKGIDVTRMKREQVEEIIETLSDLHLDVDSDCSKVRIYCE